MANGFDARRLGSRRIFAPQFKLRVLDSYRHDHDCRGNQRATARKYGIHRRQIQKWLQAEGALRGVADSSSSSSSSASCSPSPPPCEERLCPVDLSCRSSSREPSPVGGETPWDLTNKAGYEREPAPPPPPPFQSYKLFRPFLPGDRNFEEVQLTTLTTTLTTPRWRPPQS